MNIDEQLAKLSNRAVAEYLKLMSATETPPLMHVWSLLSGAGACLTRRKWFQAGELRFMPNQFILLVGPAGVRKTTGINFIEGLLKEVDGLRFMPGHTAARQQGLLAEMLGPWEAEVSEEDKIIDTLYVDLDFSADADSVGDTNDTHRLNKHALYVSEGEFTNFIGTNQDEFINVLGSLWDASNKDSVGYRLKHEAVQVPFPCLNMIGAITPMHITTYLPPQAIGQGFTSRLVMVYADEGKTVPWVPEQDKEAQKEFRKIFQFIMNMEQGAFDHGPGLKERVIELYSYKVRIDDVRFEHYKQRRQAHLLKAAMALASLRLSNTVTVEDVNDAHLLLAMAEKNMVECLGEHGLSPQGLAKSRVMQIMRRAADPMTVTRILFAIGSDIKQADAKSALAELEASGKLIGVSLKDKRGTIRRAWVIPSETNKFKAQQIIAVDAFVDENTTKRAASAAIENAAEALGAPQEQITADKAIRLREASRVLTAAKKEKGASSLLSKLLETGKKRNDK